MSRSFDDIVADVVRDEPPAPDPHPPGDTPTAPATDLDIGEDPEASPPPSPPTPDDTVVHPVTGEVFELADIGAAELAAMVDAYRLAIQAWTEWRRSAEDELRRRLGKDKLRVFGDWEVAAVSGRGRKWDPDDLGEAVERLIDLGVLDRGDVAHLITPGEPVVNGTLARDLLNRVRAEHRPELESCFTWERKGRASVRVTRSVDLADALPPTP